MREDKKVIQIFFLCIDLLEIRQKNRSLKVRANYKSEKYFVYGKLKYSCYMKKIAVCNKNFK